MRSRPLNSSLISGRQQQCLCATGQRMQTPWRLTFLRASCKRSASPPNPVPANVLQLTWKAERSCTSTLVEATTGDRGSLLWFPSLCVATTSKMRFTTTPPHRSSASGKNDWRGLLAGTTAQHSPCLSLMHCLTVSFPHSAPAGSSSYTYRYGSQCLAKLWQQYSNNQLIKPLCHNLFQQGASSSWSERQKSG
jgi:hypothetical protein